MAYPSYGFCSPSHSQPPWPHGDEVKDADEDPQLQETELFNDTLTEPQVENLNLNTQLVEDSHPEENMESSPTCEYGHEVVLDSEDEEIDHGEAVTAAKRLLDDRTWKTARIPSMRLQKRRMNPPCEQEDSNATTFRKAATGDKEVSVDTKRFSDSNNPCPPVRLNHINSPEPADATQAALGFVDRYLSSNDMDLFQGINYTKATREKSSHVLSARGSLSLARKIKSPTQNAEKEPFRLVDSDQNDKGAGIFCKKTDTRTNFRSYRLKYARKRQEEGSHLQNQGICSAGNRSDENLSQIPGMVAENRNSYKELKVHSNVNAYSSVMHTEEMLDIGLDTQMAAEAMEALAFVAPTGCHFDDAHQPENALDGSLSNLTSNETPLNNSLHGQNSGLLSLTKSKKMNVSSCYLTKATSSSSPKHTENWRPNLVSSKMRKMMKSKPTVKGQFENNRSSPILSEHVSLEEVCSTGEYTGFQSSEEPKNWNRSKWARIKDQRNHHTERNKNVKAEKGTISHKRKGADLVVDPLKLGISTKHLNLPANLCRKPSKNMLDCQVQVRPQLSATKSFLINDPWHYPKRARGKRRKANMQNKSFWCIDRKENNFYSRSLKGQDDKQKSLCKASCVDNGRCLLQRNYVQPGSTDDAVKFRNLRDMHPLLLAHVEISSNKSDAQSNSKIPATIASVKGIKFSNADHTYEHHKRQCDKNLRRSSLLKELVRLGVSEPTSGLMLKDPRQRRDVTFARVLFSQHLDDSIVKQQKKIMARLSISTASSSMEATHFIADKFTRTKNMLEIMALGKLVVTHLWLESCGQANCFIDEKNYILRDVKKEKEIGFSMPASLARARHTPLLKGKRVYITPHTTPTKEVLASLVMAVHGQVVDETQIHADRNDKSLDDLLILSCEEDYEICHPFLERGTAVYSSELLLNGIVIQKLELVRHQLFVSEATRNVPSTSNRFGKVYRRRSRPVSQPIVDL